MSNDVHIAKVSKIQKSSKSKSPDNMVIKTRDLYQHEKNYGQNVKSDYIFGSTSPRSIKIHVLSSHGNELESPDHTQRDTNESDNNISSCSTLDIINKVENLTLQHLELKVKELNDCLQKSNEERVEMQHQLAECNAEKELCYRQLEVLSASHECRMTEMHCVIAELSKKLRAKQENVIVEELEPEGSELSFQEGSAYNSEINLTNPEVECQTEPLETGGRDCSTGTATVDQGDEHFSFSEEMHNAKMSESFSRSQVEALQEEILHLKAQIALLQSEVANTCYCKNKLNEQISPSEDNLETKDSTSSLEQLQFTQFEEKELNDLNADFKAPLKPCKAIGSPQKDPAKIPKMAERIKLRCASKQECNIAIVTASDLRKSEIKNADIVEHLVADLKQNNSLLESFTDSTQLDQELQRLQRRIEHLKVQNTLLSLTLSECKEHCEHLYLLCGKYESNAIALQSALNCSDRAIEAYDVMLALLESKSVLVKERTVSGEESRKAVESVARHLLDRLENEKNIFENSTGPWQNTFTIPDKVSIIPWTTEDDSRLRYHVSKLKGCRFTVQNTIVNLESPFSDLYEKSRLALENAEKELLNKEKSTQQDLENAVLMQELLNAREENVTLKTRNEDLEKEHLYTLERVDILEMALKKLQLHLQKMSAADSSVLFHQTHLTHHCGLENRISYSESEQAALTEQQLVEALSRESELKGRIQTLIASIATTQKVSDGKLDHLQNNIKDLQKTNSNLTQSLEQSKRKYQARLRKMEQKIIEMSRSAANVETKQVRNKNLTNSSMQHGEFIPETTL